MNEQQLRKEFIKWQGLNKTYEINEANQIADFWLQKMSEQKERLIKEVEKIEKDMTEAEVCYDPTVDITNLPPELIAEMTGMKKGWVAALKQVKELINK